MTRLTQLNPTEDQEAEALAQWLRLKKLPFTHIANESGRGRTAMLRTAKLKRMGQSKGFPDYLIAIPSHIPYLEVIKDGENCIERRVDKRLIAIELKRQKGGHVSPSQREWLKILNSAGIEAVVCHGFEEAKKFIEERLK
mgnify:FL=1|jgi:hypothetical protein